MKQQFLSITSTIVRIMPGWLKQGLYRLGPISNLIRQTLNLLSPEGFSKVTIASGRAEGLVMDLDLKKEKDYWLGTYEPKLQEMIHRYVREGWTAYDVGANIGYFSLILAKTVGISGDVYAFEAMPGNVKRLKNNLVLNEVSSRVKVLPYAVINESKPVQFLPGPSGAMGKVEGSAGRHEGHRESFEVQGISLDDFIADESNRPPNVIKMDIEGGEVLAIQGMKKVLTEIRPLIFLEIHGSDAAKSVWAGLNEVGYQISELKPGFPQVSSWENLDWKSYLTAIP